MCVCVCVCVCVKERERVRERVLSIPDGVFIQGESGDNSGKLCQSGVKDAGHGKTMRCSHTHTQVRLHS